MKHLNRIAVITAVLFGSTSAHAGWGILAGLNFANISTDPDSSLSTKGAFMGGLAFEGHVAPGFDLELDALYLNSKYTQPIAGIDTTTTLKAIQVPIMLRFNLIPFLNLGFGGYASFGLGHLTTEAGGVSIEHDYDGTLKKVDLGLIGSARLSIPVGLAHLVVDGRYNFGLTNLADSSTVNSIKTRSFQALAGVMFGI